MYKKIYNEIVKNNKIIIIRHKAPDYDAYGSQIGLYLTLKETFKGKNLYIDGDENSSNIFNIKMDALERKDYKDALVIILDTSSKNMISNDYYKEAKKVIIMDHHNNIPDLGDINLIDSSYSSASELVALFSLKMKLKITKEAAYAYLVGIVGDSNRFLYKGTTSNTFKVASALLDKGADLLKTYESMKKEDNLNEKRFRGYYLSNFIVNDNVCYIYNSKEKIKEYNINALYASRACINLMADIKGIDAFMSFTEEDDKIYFELRSKKKSVVKVCQVLGGGGHDLACGATLTGKVDIEKIVNMVKEELKK